MENTNGIKKDFFKECSYGYWKKLLKPYTNSINGYFNDDNTKKIEHFFKTTGFIYIDEFSEFLFEEYKKHKIPVESRDCVGISRYKIKEINKKYCEQINAYLSLINPVFKIDNTKLKGVEK